MIIGIMEKLTHRLDAMMFWVLTIVLVLVPIFFLSLTQNYYDTNKWMLLTTGALVILLLWALRTLVTKTAVITVSPLTIGLGALTFAEAASLAIASTNKVEAAVNTFGVATVTSLMFLVLLGGHVITGNRKTILRWSFFTVMSVLGLIAICQVLGFGKIFESRLPFLSDPLWTPTGSSVSLIVLLLTVLPICIEEAITSLRAKRELPFVNAAIATLIATVTIMSTTCQFLPKLPGVVLPLRYGWAVMGNTMKNPILALFGVGSENFLPAFSASRPAALNMTGFWTARFIVSSSTFLHLTTTLGLLGIFAIGLLLCGLWHRNLTIGEKVSALIGMLAVLFAPPSFVVLVLLVTLVCIQTGKKQQQRSWSFQGRFRFASMILSFVAFLLAVTVGYFVGRSYAAELTFFRSLLATQRNNGTETYNLQIRTIGLNPYIPRYHMAYSQTNFALASAITASANQDTESAISGKLSDSDRQLVMTLVQQSVREAKIATQLAPNNVLTWENLGRIYQSLVPLAQGADTWAVASFSQAIQLDPTNPLLRLDLGGIYVGQQNFDSAVQEFLAATQLKPDFANAYYNLASVYRLSGETDKAIVALEKARTLVPFASSDYTKATNEIENLKKNTTAPASSLLGETLTNPSSPAPAIVPPLTLPQE